MEQYLNESKDIQFCVANLIANTTTVFSGLSYKTNTRLMGGDLTNSVSGLAIINIERLYNIALKGFVKHEIDA